MTDDFVSVVRKMNIREATSCLEAILQGNSLISDLIGDDASIDNALSVLVDLSVEVAGADSIFAMPGIVPYLVSIIAGSRQREENEKLRQAYGLYALHRSGAWRVFAEEVDGEPSWKEFVDKWLPGMAYTTSVNRILVIRAFGERAGWSFDRLSRIGISKLTAARKFVEIELDNGGVTPDTERVLEEGTFDGVVRHIAEHRVPDSSSSSDVSMSEAGVIRLFVDGFPYEVGKLNLAAPEHVSQAAWDSVIDMAVRGIRGALSNNVPILETGGCCEHQSSDS
jgi:hypothetical protein